MLLSLGVIVLAGMATYFLFSKINIPGIIGLLFAGIILGPGVLDIIDSSLRSISSEIRSIALIIILTRAGLSLNIEDLRAVGRPAVLMSFIPASFEIIGVVLIAPLLFPLTIWEALIMGAVVAAVSPAIIVPSMIKIMQKGYGNKRKVPQLILASASIDDIFVVVLFTIFIGSDSFSATEFLHLPLSISTGIAAGVILGLILCFVFRRFHIRDSRKVMILLAIGFVLLPIEQLSSTIPFSALIAIMAMSITIKCRLNTVTDRISRKFSKLWIFAELLLFVLIGATVNPQNLLNSWLPAIILIAAITLIRITGVMICLVKSPLNMNERFFCALSYIPKATVQAAIGSVPLSMGLACGEIILTVAVMAIIITAPIGAILIEKTYKKLLNETEL